MNAVALVAILLSASLPKTQRFGHRREYTLSVLHAGRDALPSPAHARPRSGSGRLSIAVFLWN